GSGAPFKTSSTDWQRFSATYKVGNSNLNKLRAQIYLKDQGASYDFDGAQLEPGDTPTEYIEGPAVGNVTDQTGINNGTANGGLVTTSDAKFGRAAYFDGNDDYIDISSVNPFKNNFSVSTWVNFDSVNKGADNNLIGNGTPINYNGLQILERGGKLIFAFNNNDLNSNTSLSANKWMHLAFVYKDNEKKTYINGILDGSNQSNVYQSDLQNTRIGLAPWTSNNAFDGKMDEFQVYNRALTDNEVSTIANNYTQKMGEVFNVRKSTDKEPKVSLNLNWFDEDWLKRSAITFDNSANPDTLTDYQVKLNIDYQTGMQSDFSGLRFTDSDHLTELPYWIESKTDATNA
ncbi:hypothetical protein LCGC14_3101100, partial [marine sediment metagenome]